MKLGCRAADDQLFDDIVVVQAFHHQSQHFPLPLRQIKSDFLDRLAGSLDQYLSRLCSERRLTGIGSSDSIGQLFGGNVLEQVADRTGFQHSLHQFLLLETGQRNYLDIRILLAHHAGSRRPVHA